MPLTATGIVSSLTSSDHTPHPTRRRMAETLAPVLPTQPLYCMSVTPALNYNTHTHTHTYSSTSTQRVQTSSTVVPFFSSFELSSLKHRRQPQRRIAHTHTRPGRELRCSSNSSITLPLFLRTARAVFTCNIPPLLRMLRSCPPTLPLACPSYRKQSARRARRAIGGEREREAGYT